ncbi:DMT family transporter [Actinocatenispora thailandica]|uniref:DMT family transporter n=1 Tax=Actinocatenispora thailandica TaxID=227318 RepID=UPI0031D9AB8F
MSLTSGRRSTLPTSPSAAPHAGRGIAALAAAGTCWGTTGVAVALIFQLGDAGPVAVSFWRLVGAIVALAPVVALRSARRRRRLAGTGRPPCPAPRSWRAAATRHRRRSGLLVAAGAGMAVFQAGYFTAVAHTGVAVATVVTLGAAPVLAAIGGRLLLAELHGAAGTAAVAGAVAGLSVLVVGDGTGSATVPGIGFALVSAAGYAATTLIGRDLGRRGQADAYTLTLVSFAVAAVLLAPLAWLTGPLPHTTHPGESALLLAYVAVVTTAVAYPLYFAGTGTVRAATAAVVTLTEPLCAAVLAVAVLGERLGAATVLGMVVLAGSIVALARTESTTARARPTGRRAGGAGRR